MSSGLRFAWAFLARNGPHAAACFAGSFPKTARFPLISPFGESPRTLRFPAASTPIRARQTGLFLLSFTERKQRHTDVCAYRSPQTKHRSRRVASTGSIGQVLSPSSFSLPGGTLRATGGLCAHRNGSADVLCAAGISALRFPSPLWTVQRSLLFWIDSRRLPVGSRDAQVAWPRGEPGACPGRRPPRNCVRCRGRRSSTTPPPTLPAHWCR